MSTTATLQTLSDSTGTPVDPNVRVPDSVARAGQAAEELHQRFYAKEPPAADPPAPQVTPEPVASPAPASSSPEGTPPAPAQTETPPPPKPGDENVTAEEWRHRFLSMQGRFNAQKVTIGSMETQMAQMGQELIHVQNQLATLQTAPQPQTLQTRNTAPTSNNKLITDQDRADYGEELIDLARRAGREAVAGDLEALREENQRLTRQVKSTSRRDLYTYLDTHLPSWRAINRDTRFTTWLRLPNVYTKQLRKAMLDAAVDGADAPLVLQFFTDFLRESQATGHTAPAQQTEQPAPPAAPRTPAVALETLAAPGKARPASGDSSVPSEKPIYTRAQISRFYEDSRRGLYKGRMAEYDAIQADLTLAQREGRIR